ncbi:polysaccharide deacetylase family protein [Candidatus Saccharibacteria bacterium]|nr:polysaccharide deacetylase family protein [Candidatus Saccharibacteria bacterium]
MSEEKKTEKKEESAIQAEPTDHTVEKPPKKHRNLFLTLFLVVLFLTAGGIFAFVALKQEFNTTGFHSERKLNYGVEYQEDFGRICYGSVFDCKDAELETSGSIDTKELGAHEITIKARSGDKEVELKQIVTIVDEEAPVISTEIEQIKVCPNDKIPTFAYSVQDNFDGELTDKATLTHDKDKGIVTISIEDSSRNVAEKSIPATVGDETAPVITMNGEAATVAYIGGSYDDAGATVADNCDDVELKVNSTVNTGATGTYSVEYSATDNSGNTASAKRTVEVKQPENGIIYLTFDDGPGVHTGRLLDILKKYNIKATFFVTCSGSDDLILREYNEGHTVGLHTCTHAYDYIYQDEGTFFSDLERIQNRVKNITGFTSTITRFPGGSSNTVSARYDGGQRIMSKLTKSVQDRGFTYFDWNISSGDAGGANTSSQVYNTVVSHLGHGGSYVVLQHDIKGFSVDAVEGIINYGLSHGYVFMPLTTSSFTAHHGVNN